MKRILSFSLVIFLLAGSASRADEGMWLLPLLEKLNINTMRQMGLQLTAEQIYSINQSSLKDAIVVFGGGCTGEIVSGDGLLFTNHHCGRGAIHQHSTVEHDYLADGFWAMSREEELPTPGLSVTFLVRMEDVSREVGKAIKNAKTEQERNEKIRDISLEITTEATRGTHYLASVRSFFGGNQFFLLVYERFTDVRLVGAPPSSIGNFGADTDNWTWPRHTGDFSIFRVYMGPDGKPANYAPENIPLKPKYFLPVSLKGIEPGDFSMVLGNPGGTTRYMTSYEIDEVQEITHPNRILLRGERLDIMLEDMLRDPVVMTQYRAKFSGASNSWKFSIGQSKGLNDLKVKDEKKRLEEKFMQWVKASEKREKEYGETLSLIENAIAARKDFNHTTQYLSECFIRGAEVTGFAPRLRNLHSLLKEEKPGTEAIQEETAELKSSAEDFFRNYNPPTDQKVLAVMLELFSKNVKPELHPSLLTEIAAQYKGDFKKYSADLFSSSVFTDKERYETFLEKPDLATLEKESIYKLSLAFQEKYQELQLLSSVYDADLQKGQRLYIAGLMEMQDDRVFYPDANSTFRLTYGKVMDYYPRDAVHYSHYTTLKGVMEKEDPDNWEFVVPWKLKELYEKADFGPYGMNGNMPVCFITDNDITGGNSGSPVMNSKGELIGLAFDGNWEAMSGDIEFEPSLQRCIVVDIRYVLFIIDKFAGAEYLIKELNIRN